MKKIAVFAFFITSNLLALPNICTVVKSSSFKECLQLHIQNITCPYPPRPCAFVTYYVPQVFIESVSNPKESFFSSYPPAAGQIASTTESAPLGAEEDHGAYSFHAHTINVPFTDTVFSLLPCGATPTTTMCFSSMSEHLGRLWKTGEADLSQPLFLAWSQAPKACLLKGAATSITGSGSTSGYSSSDSSCSYDHSWYKKFPPSSHAACNGWGTFYPRYATYIGADQTTASAMIAARMKSIGNEVFNSVPSGGDEKWQMIYPQDSSCFREGQNISFLRLKRVNEYGRLTSGKVKNFLYVTWKRTGCIVESYEIPTIKLRAELIKTVCQGL